MAEWMSLGETIYVLPLASVTLSGLIVPTKHLSAYAVLLPLLWLHRSYTLHATPMQQKQVRHNAAWTGFVAGTGLLCHPCGGKD
jgi:hypothetical protein